MHWVLLLPEAELKGLYEADDTRLLGGGGAASLSLVRPLTDPLLRLLLLLQLLQHLAVSDARLRRRRREVKCHLLKTCVTPGRNKYLITAPPM